MYETIVHQNGTQLTLNEMFHVGKRAESMEGQIKRLFDSHPHNGFTAEEVLTFLGGLLTSVRRSLSNLKNSGYLIKDLTNKKPGSHQVRIVSYKKA